MGIVLVVSIKPLSRKLIEGIVRTIVKIMEQYVDEMFSVDLPNSEERREILEIHINKKNRGHLITAGRINLSHFAGDTSEGFTGAEIEAAINEALYAAFDAQRDLNALDLQDAFDNTNPLSQTMKEKIDKIRDWCACRTRPANSIVVVSPSPTGRSVQA